MNDIDGSMSLELVVLAPVVALFGVLGLGLGRYEIVRAQVLGAAHSSAEAAAVSPVATAAPSAAEAVAGPILKADSHSCPTPEVVTDTSAFVAGGPVAVTVTCSVPLSDLVPVLPGSLTVSGASSVPIDSYRSIG